MNAISRRTGRSLMPINGAAARLIGGRSTTSYSRYAFLCGASPPLTASPSCQPRTVGNECKCIRVSTSYYRWAVADIRNFASSRNGKTEGDSAKNTDLSIGETKDSRRDEVSSVAKEKQEEADVQPSLIRDENEKKPNVAEDSTSTINATSSNPALSLPFPWHYPPVDDYRVSIRMMIDPVCPGQIEHGSFARYWRQEKWVHLGIKYF